MIYADIVHVHVHINTRVPCVMSYTCTCTCNGTCILVNDGCYMCGGMCGGRYPSVTGT